jgi:hypothetical protein
LVAPVSATTTNENAPPLQEFTARELVAPMPASLPLAPLPSPEALEAASTANDTALSSEVRTAALRPALGQGWSEPVNVSNGEAGWFPNIAADDFGNVHIVWNGFLPDHPDHPGPHDTGTAAPASSRLTDALYYTHTGGEAWAKPEEIAYICCGHALRSALTTDPTGRLHLLYKGLGVGQDSLRQEDIWHTAADIGQISQPQPWKAPKRINRSFQGYFSDVAIDSRGVLHAITMESIQGSYGIFYNNSTDGGEIWSERIALEEADAVWWYRAQIKIDTQDRIHVVWEVLDPSAGLGAIKASVYAQSTDGGKTWSRVRFTRPASAGPQQPAIGIDGNGTIVYISRDPTSNRILYQISTDGVRWSEATPIPGVDAGVPRGYDMYDTVTDSAGHVHLALVGYPTGSTTMSLLHAEWDGRRWATVSLVAASPPYPEYPRLALSEGNQLHLVWFTGDRPSTDREPTGVWYSTRELPAPRTVHRMQSQLSAPQASDPPEPLPTAAPRAPQRTTVVSEPEPFSAWLSGLRESPTYPLIMAALALMGLLALVGLVASGCLQTWRTWLWRD